MTESISQTPASSSYPAWPREIERYRASILAFGAFGTAGLLKLADLLSEQRPLGGVDWLSLLVALIVLAAVYWPRNAWVKFAAGIVGAVGQTLVAVFTDGRVTPAELITVGVTLLVALGIGAAPNPTAQQATVPDAEPSV